MQIERGVKMRNCFASTVLSFLLIVCMFVGIPTVDAYDGHISTHTIEVDGTYYEDYITYPKEKESDKINEAFRYKFYLPQPAMVKLHFISYIDKKIYFKLLDEDEMAIKPFCKLLLRKYSPFTEQVMLDAGNYTFVVYKYYTNNAFSNTGKFKFKFDARY